MNNYEKIKSLKFEEKELCKFLEKYYKQEIKAENYKYFGDDKFVLLPTALLNETFGFSAYKLRIKFKNISKEIPFQTKLGQGRTKYFAFKGFKPTNFQKIKSMSIDEMAEFIDELTNSGEYTCPYCQIYNNSEDDDISDKCNYACVEGVKQWLQKECEQ